MTVLPCKLGNTIIHKLSEFGITTAPHCDMGPNVYFP